MEASKSTNFDSKILSVGLLLVATFVAAKLISALIMPRSRKRLPPSVNAWPVLGGLIRFMKGPVVMLREEYPKLGSVFTLKLLNKNITFLIGPEVSAHFFKAQESDLSQQEVYQFNVPTFGPGVVFDVDYSIRQEQFRFFTEALRVSKLKGYVDQMVMEAEDYFSKWGDSGEVDLKYELEHLIILTASRCLLVLFPYLPIPAHRRRDQARKKLAEIFANIIASRKQTGKTQNDLLQCFIDSKYKDGRLTTEAEVTGLLIAALFAGQHTSSITSTWSGAYLLRNPKYMSAVLDEQKNLMQKHGNKIDYDILDFSVKTREGIEYDIPKGHIVATSPAFANRLPHIYKDPDTYDPERFAPGRDEDKAAGAFSYISFGGGRHGCLGEPFAYLQIKAIWSHLLRNFEMELISPFPEIDWNAMVVGVKGKVISSIELIRLCSFVIFPEVFYCAVVIKTIAGLTFQHNLQLLPSILSRPKIIRAQRNSAMAAWNHLVYSYPDVLFHPNEFQHQPWSLHRLHHHSSFSFPLFLSCVPSKVDDSWVSEEDEAEILTGLSFPFFRGCGHKEIDGVFRVEKT
ncbi:Sterol 14-demethylase [Sesamum angolense]|uniref:Sterol 14-demethylase n=1 Tax=Sesamum angolense TaxID=2727404 RepID=A0AAE2BXK6_9LAMI|nr:Sterol 14-demethylase [Sesamum angolense]